VKVIVWVVGLLLVLVAGLFAVFTFVVKPRSAGTVAAAPPAAPAAAAPKPKTDATAQRISAAGDLIAGLGNAAESIGLSF
jgi:hypothetical protein